MNETCSIVQDLLPLYAEEMVREETKGYIEAHLAECSACRDELDALRAAVPAPEISVAPLRDIQKELRRRKLTAVLLAVALALTVAMSGFAFLTAPQYMACKELDFAFIVEDGSKPQTILRSGELSSAGHDLDGVASVQVVLLTPVSGMKAERSFDENGRTIYTVTAWRTLLSEWLGEYDDVPVVSAGDDTLGVIAGGDTTTVIVTEGLQQAAPLLKGSGIRTITLSTENCAGIYYAPNDGSENIMLLGAHRDGGMISLPRLALGPYLLLALGLGAALGGAWLLCRRRRCGAALWHCALAPACYVCAHLLIKGFSAVSYNLTRDLALIVLTGALLYGAAQAGIALARSRQAQ